MAQRDSKAFDTLYHKYFPAIRNLVVNNNGNYDDANDVFQEAVITLYEKVRGGNFELNCQLSTFIYSICKRLWLKKLSREISVVTSLEDAQVEESVPTDDDIELQAEKTKEFDIMHQAIQTIGEPCKSILNAYYIDKKDMETIAQAFGYTNAANAKNQKYKCLVRLKKIFFEKFQKEEQ